MVFKFRIVSDGAENFKREIQIDATATFFDLKNAICDSVGYEKTQLDSFFLCDDGWEKGKEIAYEDMGFDTDQEVWMMDEEVLEDFIDDEGQKMLYVFDYMTDRALFMEMTEIITGKTLLDPICSLALGQAPPQTIDIDEFDRQVDAKAAKAKETAIEDLDEEFYGSEEFNPDEFEAAGYDELDY